jgi:hypothetical protein
VSASSSSSSGIGVFGLLGVLFVGLKLGGVIAWSWIWVTAPFWGGLALCLAIWAFVIGMIGLAAIFGAWKR